MLAAHSAQNSKLYSGSAGVQIFPNTLPTTRTHHYSADVQYDLGHQFVASLGYQGSISRDTYFNQNPLAVPAAAGFALNPSINAGNFLALFVPVNHQPF